MPQFNVGDRVRFINENSNGGRRYGRVGETGVITRHYGRESYAFQFESPDRHREVGFTPGVSGQDIELVEAVPQPEEAQTATVYTVFYRSNGRVLSVGKDTQEGAEIVKQGLLENGAEVIAMKKIKINLGQ